MTKSLYYLPDDVLLYTCDKLTLIDKRSLVLINKNNPFVIKLNNEYSSLIKIQRFYKRNLPRLHVSPQYNPKYDSLFSKKELIRLYIASYPMEYLLKFPETYINNMFSTNVSGINLKHWLKKNLPIDTNKRTRRDIKKFLDHPKVTRGGINDSGW